MIVHWQETPVDIFPGNIIFANFLKTVKRITMLRILAMIALLQVTIYATAQPVGKYFTFGLTSKITGQDYELYVSLPDGYNEKDTARYPVLYVLDGYFMFQVMQASNRALNQVGQIQNLIIVGIGYKGVSDIMKSMENRTPDYTPTRDTAFENELNKDLKLNITSGRADKFLSALKKEILPYIEKKYRITDRGIAGHSFGALFGTYTLLTEPSLFKKYLLSSISTPWDKQVLLKLEDAFYQSGVRSINADVFVTVGAEETWFDMITDMKKLTAAMKQHYKGINIEERVLQYENHPAAYLTAFNQGLRWLYKK